MRSAFLATFLLATAAAAQTAVPEFRLERFHFNSGARDGLTAASGDLLDEGQLHALLGLHWELDPLVLLTEGKRTGALVSNRVTLHAVVGYGITRFLHAQLELPFILFQGGETLAGVKAPDAGGISTPLISMRLGLLGQKNRGVLLQQSAIDLAVQLGAVLPLATGSTLSREFAFVPQLSAGRQFDKFRFGGEFSAWIRPSNVTLTQGADVVRDNVGTQLALKAIGSYQVIDPLNLELSAHFGFPLALGSTPIGAEVMLGARYRVWLLDLFAIVGKGFGQLPGIPNVRVLAGVSLVPKKDVCAPGEKHLPSECPGLDDDGDGVLNKVDKCPTVKEDADGFEDDDGCVDPDDDKDGILDVDDACRLVKGVKEEKGCPAKPKDTDKDGLIDEVDKCPTEFGPKERQGCPVRDADKDGIEDEKDQCPNEAGPPERNGCPIKDRDGDTVEDNKDNCPDEKGEVDNSGCPKAKKQLVEITREKLIIKDKIFFATGKAVILPKSFPLLDQVAEVLKGHSEITMVTIEGHTDNVGKRDYNVKLSQSRADSVKDYLSKKGVEANRLRSIGYGPDRPADTNATADGKANNRRVEFMIETAETVKTQTKEIP